MKKGLRTYNPAGMRSRKGILPSKILNLADKMAFVTGSGGGMGQAMVVTLISDKDYIAKALQTIPVGRSGEIHDAVDSVVFWLPQRLILFRPYALGGWGCMAM
jgi:hypothetical protein